MPELPPTEMRRRLAEARVGVLGTVTADGGVQLVPVCFVLAGETLLSAVDDKPKRSRDLQRLRNVAARPTASLLVDRYDEDWASLWWVRASGRARVVGDALPEARTAHRLLRQKYPQYEQHELGDVLAIDIERWRSWCASAQSG